MPSRADRRSGRTPKSPTGTYLAIAAVVLVVVLAVAIALVVANSGGSDFDPATYSVELSGSPLTRYSSSADSAVGRTAPNITGTDFDGNTVQVTPDGRPVILMFLAHWCSHCQNEVNWLTPWFQDNGLPEGVRVLSVATSIDETLPNYPPDTWLNDWQVPVIVDDTQNTAAAYFGLSAFPYWVILNGDGTVRERFTGEVELEEFQALVDKLS